MYNYFKLFWGGALLHYARWLYTSNDNRVIIGVLATISCVLFYFFKAAVILGVITLLYWVYIILRPEHRYILRLSDNSRLYLFLYYVGRNKGGAKKKHQSILLHVFTDNANQQPQKKDFLCKRYDDSLKDCGLFLISDKKDLWTLISSNHPFGAFLGGRVQNNLFSDGTTLNFLHGHEIVALKADRFKMPPFGLTYDANKATYRSLGHDEEDFSELKSHMLLMTITDKKARLFAFGISETHVPLAFQVFVPFVYPPHCPVYDRGVLPISVDEKDGSFMLF